MNNGDARQAVEVGSVQREDVSHLLRQHHGREMGVMGALAANLGGCDQGQPALEGWVALIE
jgi:hypothetical protein